MTQNQYGSTARVSCSQPTSDQYSRGKLRDTVRLAAAVIVVAVAAGCHSGRSSNTAAPSTPMRNGQWDVCGGLSADVEHRAGFVRPSQDELERGYSQNGSGEDPRSCDRVTKDLSLTFATWSGPAYAEKHGSGSTPYPNVSVVTIDGRKANQSYKTDHDCRLEFHLQNGNVIVINASTRSEQSTTPACDLLRPVAAAVSPTMPR